MVNKEKLIIKWLNDELTPEEFEAFKQLDEYSSYAKLSDKAKYFKAPEFDENASLNQIKKQINTKTKKSKSLTFRYVATIAAVFVVSFLIFKTLNSNSAVKDFETTTAKTEILSLPDQSKVNLNANSKLSYNKTKWESKRNLTLEGEAFFEVEKGKTFTVKTDYGEVEVLGTVFNVKSRDYTFQVTCFEGSVKVSVNDKNFVLKPKDKLVFDNGKININQTNFSTPDWKSNQTRIESKPLKFVLKEFTNYYDVSFKTSDVNTSRLYTGSFKHEDLEIALKSITLPLGLTYKINGKIIALSNK